MKKVYRVCLPFFIFLLLFSCGTIRRNETERQAGFHERQLKTGDLLFAYDPRGNAITAVTSGYHGLSSKGVTLTPLADFLAHNTMLDEHYPSVVRGRLRVKFNETVLRKRLNHYLGLPYDSLYMPDDSAMYCSELVQKCFVLTDGKAVFPTIPMSFHDADGHITPYWKAFYARHGKSVPEGMSGTNPGQLSREKVVHIRLSRIF